MKHHGQAHGIPTLRLNPAGLPVVRNPAPKTIHPRVNPWSSGAWISGFGLLRIIIVVAFVVSFSIGGGMYWNETKKQQSFLQIGADAQKRAEELKQAIESRHEQIYGGRTSINSSKESLDATQNYTAYNSEESFGGINMGDSIFLNWYIVPDGASKIRLYRSSSSQGPWIRVYDYPVDGLKYGPVDGVDGTKADLYYKAEAISPSEAVLKEYGVLRIPKYIDENGGLESSKIDTSTWKTYRNEKYGFEVRYPDSSSVIEMSDKVVIKERGSGENPTRSVFIQFVPQKDSFDFRSYYNKYIAESFDDECVSVTKNNLAAFKCFPSEYFPGEVFYFKRGDMIFEVGSLEHKFGNEIISTFKFTN